MDTISLRILLALAALSALASATAADELWFSDSLEQPEIVEPSFADHTGLLPVDFETETSEIILNLPDGGVVTESDPFSDDSVGPAVVSEGDVGRPNCNSQCNDRPAPSVARYADVEFMFLRPHVGEEAIGKLAEKYEFSPRFILGFEKASGMGGRVRYWTYDRTTPNLENGGDSLRLNFDVLDLEGTSRIGTGPTELVIAGGFRWADVKIDVDGDRSRNDMPGGTFAVDLRSSFCCDDKRNWEWASLAGARWSVFGGDWEGSEDGLIEPTRDDNIVVQELYGGIECWYYRCGCDFYTRIVFEVQNWRSDALGEDADIDSLGFIGPGIYTGAAF